MTDQENKPQINKYNKGKIYKIISNVDKCIPYFGSTVEKYISDRYGRHKRGYTEWKQTGQGKHLTSYDVFDKYGLDNCKAVLVEQCNVNSREELLQREQYYIDTFECVNKINAIISDEQRREIKRRWEQRNPERNMQYYQQNKDHIKQISKQYYNENKEEIRQKQKTYREMNVEKIKEQKKQERIKNAARYKEYSKIDVRCDVCDCNVRKGKLKRHERSKKHNDNLIKETPPE